MDWSSCIDKTNDTSTGVATIACVQQVFANLISAALLLVGTTTVVLLIIGGLRYMQASGDAKKLDSARKTILYAIIGLLIVLFSFLILRIIIAITGVSCLQVFGPFGSSGGFLNCAQ